MYRKDMCTNFAVQATVAESLLRRVTDVMMGELEEADVQEIFMFQDQTFIVIRE